MHAELVKEWDGRSAKRIALTLEVSLRGPEIDVTDPDDAEAGTLQRGLCRSPRVVIGNRSTLSTSDVSVYSPHGEERERE